MNPVWLVYRHRPDHRIEVRCYAVREVAIRMAVADGWTFHPVPVEVKLTAFQETQEVTK